MEKIRSWTRIILTWVVIIPDLLLSYVYLRYPSYNLEISSLTLNFIAATVIFYVYMDISKDGFGDEGEGEKAASSQQGSISPLYNLTFGSLIEDFLVWLGLFLLLYNIVPVTLYIHNLVGRSL